MSDKIKSAGYPIGIIVAETMEIAYKAVKKVKVSYDAVKKPILTITDALKKAEEEGKLQECFLPEKGESLSTSVGAPKHTVKGEMEIGGQYHFQMETQIALCVPREDGMDVFSATQWMDLTQAVVASTLGMPNNRLVRPCGHSLEHKINISASATIRTFQSCAVLTSKFDVSAVDMGAKFHAQPWYLAPVPSPLIILDLESNMAMIGKRLPYWAKYEVRTGNITGVDVVCDLQA